MVKTVDGYMEGLPEERKEICRIVRGMLLENIPGIIEKLSFKIPFYHYHGMFMYLNNTPEGVDVAFCRGKDLIETFPQLKLGSRAIVATVCIKHKKEIVTYNLREMIITAATWNEEAKRLKLPMVKKAVSKKQRV